MEYDIATLFGNELYFAAGHLLLAILAGIGFMLLAVMVARPATSSQIEPLAYKPAASLSDSTL
jgi:hypothetical protein